METEDWRRIGSMKTRRAYPHLYTVNHQLTVFGGDPSSKSIEYLNETGSWEMSQDSLEKEFSYGVSAEVKCPV